MKTTSPSVPTNTCDRYRTATIKSSEAAPANSFELSCSPVAAYVVPPISIKLGILCPTALSAAPCDRFGRRTLTTRERFKTDRTSCLYEAFDRNMSAQSIVGTSLPTQLFEPLLDSREAAALLHIHHKTLERKARQGEIPAYQVAGRWYFRASELDTWLKSRLNSASQSVRVN